MSTTRTGLPPGQRAIEGFPRFGTHLRRRPPEVPEGHTIEVVAPGLRLELPVADVAALPREVVRADFHCVSGWSATGIAWAGAPFSVFFAAVVEPHVASGTRLTHVVFSGLDGHESQLLLEDALGVDVLLADELDGRPLGPDHGAPVRLVSPAQYGYQSCKHLSRIEFLDGPLDRELGAGHQAAQVALRGPLIVRHPRARVWQEERHTFLPARLLRPIYRRIYERAFRLGLGGEPPRHDQRH